MEKLYEGTGDIPALKAIWSNLKDFPKSLSLSATVAGILIVLIATFGTGPIVVQAAIAGKLTDAQTASWFFTVLVGSGLYGLYLSLRMRMPLIGAWSTPSAALLVTALVTHTINEAVAAYFVSAILLTIIGWAGLLEKILAAVPRPVTMAMLGGILFNFGVAIFPALIKEPIIVLVMIAFFFIGRRFNWRAPVVASFFSGLIASVVLGKAHQPHLNIEWAKPVWVSPHFTLGAIFTLGIPLLLLTLTSQYAPGMSILTSFGYKAPVNRSLVTGGVISLTTAGILNSGINCAAITAAIGSGEQAEPDKDRRYTAGVVCGLGYALLGLFGSTFMGFFGAIPSAMLVAIAGLALLPAIANSTHEALVDPQYREAALVTLLITVSNVQILKLGAPFWGLVGGVIVHQIVEYRRR
jgi:benzoate membrane transport protein